MKQLMRHLVRYLVPMVFSLGLSAGCNYQSSYRPPADGRARGVWQKDKIVMYAPSTEAPVCRAGRLDSSRRPRSTREGYWLADEHHATHHHHTGGGSVHVVVVGRPVVPVPFVPLPGVGGGGGAFGNDADPRIFAVLAVGALIALPIVTVALALGHPEPEDEVATEIDRINRYNDAARHAWRRCGIGDEKAKVAR
jgi:hypothetical protein